MVLHNVCYIQGICWRWSLFKSDSIKPVYNNLVGKTWPTVVSRAIQCRQSFGNSSQSQPVLLGTLSPRALPFSPPDALFPLVASPHSSLSIGFAQLLLPQTHCWICIGMGKQSNCVHASNQCFHASVLETPP